MLRAIIVEDELYIRKGLISMLNELNKNISVIAECTSVEEGVEKVKKLKPDLVFLDVELTDGNGFDVIQETKELTYKVIFITAYKEYALKALKSEVTDYLLKPITPVELEKAIDKVEKQLQNKPLLKDHLILSLQDCYQLIDFKSLLFCKSDKGYTTFYLDNNKEIIASKPIKEFEESLVSSSFYRTHQSYIVNLNYIDSYNKTGYIILKTGHKIPVSKSKKEEFLSLFLS